MDPSLFLAKVVGLYLLIISIALLNNRANFMRMVDDLVSSPGVTAVSGIVALILGILMVVVHNIWVWDWRVVLTLLAWITLLKGVLRLFVPDSIERMAKWYHNRAFYYGTGILTLLLGVFLCYHGFLKL